MERSEAIDRSEHWVVKIGSSVFLRDDRHVDRPTFAGLVGEVDDLLASDRRATLVSSGAVALGREHLGWREAVGGTDIPEQQALAALGQSRLMEMYETELAHYDRKVAQILFSRADLDDRERFLNARRALRRLHEYGAVPVINENDSVATGELRFGDNDRLAAMTCGVVEADLLVLLSDVEGILRVEGRDESGSPMFGERLSSAPVDDPILDDVAGPARSDVGTGGMVSKVMAARIAARLGTATVVAPGKKPGVLGRLFDGEDVGTYLDPETGRELEGKKVWLGAGARPVGVIRCDRGARAAIVEEGASLLPAGITGVEGTFSEGSVVELRDGEDELFARGVAVYGADELREIGGRSSEEIDDILDRRLLDCAVHRDSLVVLDS